MAKIVILGAGLTGLSTAYHLEQQQFDDYVIFEKEPDVGGLCRSIVSDGFTFDYTGHLLHVSSPYFRELLSKVFGMDAFNTISRKSYIYSQGIYTKYPYQINLHGLPVDTMVECLEEYLNRPATKRSPKTFREWVITNFGKGFGEHFFFPYQEKIFSYPIDKLSASWTGRFVPKTSLKEMLQGALGEYNEPVGYNANFYYPKHGGIASWVQALANKIQKPIAHNFTVSSIDLAHKQIVFENGHIESYDTLINTIPLDIFIHKIKDKPSTLFKRALRHLKCNQVLNFNLGIAKKDLTDKHWIYFPESNYPFYRLGFPYHFSSHMAPAECSSLYGECSVLYASQEEKNHLIDRALKKTYELLDIQPDEVITKKIIEISHAYVIFDQWRDKNLPKLHAALHELDIYSIGRYGTWKYSSMQEAILDGKEITEKIISDISSYIIRKPLPIKEL